VLAFLTLLLGLLALIIVTLEIPVVVTFQLEGTAFELGGAPAGHVTIRWLFGLVRLRIPLPAATKPKTSNANQAAKRKRPTHGKHSSLSGVVTVLRQAAFRRRVYRLVRDIFRALHLQRLRLYLRLGLGDPADTGRLWTIIGPLSVAAQNLRNAQVQFEPEFIDTVFEYRAHGTALLIPMQLLGLAIGFVLSPTSIRAWRTLKANHA